MSLLLSRIKILAGTRSAPSAVREREASLCKFHQKKIPSRRGQLLAKTTCKHAAAFIITPRAHTRVLILIRLSTGDTYFLLKCISLAVLLCKLCVNFAFCQAYYLVPLRKGENVPKTPFGCVCAACTERFMCAN